MIQENYEKMRPVQISDSFDAPQFCQEFIEVAKKTIKCRALKVMVYADKVNKKGVPVVSKRTGKQLKSWQPYHGK